MAQCYEPTPSQFRCAFAIISTIYNQVVTYPLPKAPHSEAVSYAKSVLNNF